jgi:hypothetical protein
LKCAAQHFNTAHHHSGLGLLTPFDVHHGLAETRLAEREATLRTAFAATPERFVRGMPVPPALPQAVWINKPRMLAVPDHIAGVEEPGERVARPPEWRSALAGRSLDGGIASSTSANEEELELPAPH